MATHRQQKRLTKKQIRKRRRKRFLIAELFILVILLGVLFVWSKVGMVDWEDIGEIEINDPSLNELLSDYMTFAVFGVDNREMGNYKSGNSDSIMIVAINKNKNDVGKKEARIISVYRDTYLDVGEGKYSKCNAAYSKGGPAQALEMLNKNLDLNIQNYVAVDFKAVIDAVDAVGGVEIEVLPEEAEVLNTYLPELVDVTGYDASWVYPGYQTLDGIQAMAYCRIRYTAGNDFRRAERQRTVLKQLFEKAKTSNLAQLNSLVNAIFPEVSTSLSLPACLSLAAGIADYDISDTAGWPFDMRTDNLGSTGDINVPCTLSSNVIKAHEYLYQDPAYYPSPIVNAISEEIRSQTGLSEQDAINYINWH